MDHVEDRRRAENSSLTPYQREERARNAARARWDRTPYGRTEATRPARDAQWQRLLDQVDPDGRLPPHVAASRAYALLCRQMQELARLPRPDRKE